MIEDDQESTILSIPRERAANNRPYRTESELAEKIEGIIHEYDGMISAVAVIGILELIKAEIIEESNE